MTTFGAAPTYTDVEGLIVAKVSEFVRQYKTDWEDTKSSALFGYVQAVRTYNPKKAEFSTWVGYKVWKAMLTFLRTEVRHSKKQEYVEDLDALPADDHFDFDQEDFLGGLSADAATACRLVLDEAPHLRLNLAALGGPPTPGNVRQAVRECLHDAGRTAKQVAGVFAELRQVL